jgi:AraC-like DNA-binding protein
MALGYNTRYLSHLINKEFGASFRDVLNECRIKEACRLLQNGKISVTEAYLEVGFDSQCTFNRNFKSIMGTTPIKYKQGFRLGMNTHSV